MSYSVNAVPGHWRRMKLKHLVQLRSGDAISGDAIKDEGEYPVYGGNGLRGYTNDFNREGDRILVGRQGALCGNINYAAGKFWATEHAIVATPKMEFETTWLGETLRAMNLNQYSQSAAQPGIAVEIIENLDIDVPPLDEQQQIARNLVSQIEPIDALIGEKRRLLGLLAEKRRALIAHAVTYGLNPDAPLRDSGIPWLGEIPAHWKPSHLKRVLSEMTYGTSQSVDAEGRIGVLRMGDINDGEVRLQKLGFLDEVDAELMLEVGDLVFNRTNSLDQIGKVALIRELPGFPLSFASYLVRLRTNSLALSRYLNYLLNSTYTNAFARSEALPSIGQANLNPDRFSYLQIPLPPLAEQDSIADYLDAESNKLDALMHSANWTISLLQERRAALISAAVTGEMNIEDKG